MVAEAEAALVVPLAAREGAGNVQLLANGLAPDVVPARTEIRR